MCPNLSERRTYLFSLGKGRKGDDGRPNFELLFYSGPSLFRELSRADQEILPRCSALKNICRRSAKRICLIGIFSCSKCRTRDTCCKSDGTKSSWSWCVSVVLFYDIDQDAEQTRWLKDSLNFSLEVQNGTPQMCIKELLCFVPYTTWWVHACYWFPLGRTAIVRKSLWWRQVHADVTSFPDAKSLLT